MFVFRYSYTLVESLAEKPMEPIYHLWDYDWTPLNQNPAHTEWCGSIAGALIGLGELVPQHPCWQASTGSLRERHPVLWDQSQEQRALLPGTLGAARKVATPSPITAPQFVPGAKPFVNDLILIWDSLCSRAALLLSTKSFNNLASWCQQLTNWKRLWCWERLRAEGEEDFRGMAPL